MAVALSSSPRRGRRPRNVWARARKAAVSTQTRVKKSRANASASTSGSASSTSWPSSASSRAGVVGGRSAVGVNRGGGGHLRPLGERDPQPPRRRADLLEKWTRRRRRPVRRGHLGAGDGVEQRRAVADAARDRVGDGEPVPELRVIRAGRGARARRLQAEEAAAGGGDADRAAAVVGVGERDDARRDGRGRASAGAARGERRIPGVPGRSVKLGFGDRQKAQLGCVGAAEGDQAGLAEAFDDRRVARRPCIRGGSGCCWSPARPPCRSRCP